MRKFYSKTIATLALAAMAVGFAPKAQAIGWPANYQGVMLQGFYWDSFTDTKWATLEANADEYSQYFKLIWVPNSGYVGGGNNMGYMPIYWFTNHNTCFGTEAQLLSMIQKYKSKGVGIIADCVINHRNGKSNWTDFPEEEWNGTKWFIGPEGICCTDEVNGVSGQDKPTGAPDTGDDFNGCRDLDHTNANVQNNCKNYVKCLQEKYGYAGMRYDMVKGYGGQFTKIYNQYANVQFSVGEYWDGNYDAVKGWIEATGKTSAAFDFPCKYCINEAFHSNDMRKLVWKANGVTDQPAGMIHFGYPQYAVTFVDNHDTYRDGSKFNGNVVAANAFILMSPGTPCVFLPHYKQYKSAIQTLINIRNSAGIHNMSPVTVLKSSQDCYMAEVTGTKGKVVVKVGSSMESPSGYSNSDIKATGNGYCVWTKVNVQGGSQGDTPETSPSKFYVIGEVNGNPWNYALGEEMVKKGDTFTATVELGSATGTKGFFSFCKSLADSWDNLNAAGNRYAPNTDTELVAGGEGKAFVECANGNDAKAFYCDKGKYDIVVDWKTMTAKIQKSGTSAVEEIESAEIADATPIYFNLQGQRVENPDNGIYIRILNGKAEKIVK